MRHSEASAVSVTSRKSLLNMEEKNENSETMKNETKRKERSKSDTEEANSQYCTRVTTVPGSRGTALKQAFIPQDGGHFLGNKDDPNSHAKQAYCAPDVPCFVKLSDFTNDDNLWILGKRAKVLTKVRKQHQTSTAAHRARQQWNCFQKTQGEKSAGQGLSSKSGTTLVATLAEPALRGH